MSLEVVCDILIYERDEEGDESDGGVRIGGGGEGAGACELPTRA